MILRPEVDFHADPLTLAWASESPVKLQWTGVSSFLRLLLWSTLLACACARYGLLLVSDWPRRTPKLTFGSCPSSGFISVYQLSVMTQSFLYFEEICLQMFWQCFKFFSFGVQPPLSLH
jgi:hypothetical protein